MNSARPKRILSIQSEVVHGHVGNGAARFALQRLGLDVLALPTVILSNHPGYGGFRGRTTPADELKSLLDGLDERGLLAGVDAVLSGYLGAPDQAEIVRDAVVRVKQRNPAACYLCDPVFGDDGGAYARPGVADAMAQYLLPLADITTPNRFELAGLTGCRIAGEADATAAARALGRPLVVATSIPAGSDLGIVLTSAEREASRMLAAPRIDHGVSGTGDLFAALFLGRIVSGVPTGPAARKALQSVVALIGAAKKAGLAELPLVAHQSWLIDPPVAGWAVGPAWSD